MRKKILLLIICALFLVGSFDAAEKAPEAITEEKALVVSFKSTEADVLESTMSCWTKLNDRFMDIEQIEAEMNRIVRRIEPDKATVVKSDDDGRLNKIVVYCFKGNRTYSIAIESVKQETAGETYAVIDVSMDRSYQELAAERKNIIDALQRPEGSMHFSSCIIGTYKGKLDEKDVDKKSKIALQSINARKIDGMENDELRSISAFSSSVGGYKVPDKASVNVQLAIRYSSYDDKTYIWIGTPLIPMGY
ncbi:MAG: YwmB family TATA-box binding protein [Gracilibacteraceae bacterium]|nr:YwmB family TATA-box binding protein [Gracilibacteraceae bacterium]